MTKTGDRMELVRGQDPRVQYGGSKIEKWNEGNDRTGVVRRSGRLGKQDGRKVTGSERLLK